MHLNRFYSSFVIKIIATNHIKTTCPIGRDMSIIHNPATTYKSNSIINFWWQVALKCGANNLGDYIHHHKLPLPFDRTDQQTTGNVSFQNNSDNNNRDDHDQDQYGHIPPLRSA